MNKPFHLMTPAERTALRIAQNQAIAKKVEEEEAARERSAPSTNSRSVRKRPSKVDPGERVIPQPPPKDSTREFTRATPEERAQRGGSLIRKVGS